MAASRRAAIARALICFLISGAALFPGLPAGSVMMEMQHPDEIGFGVPFSSTGGGPAIASGRPDLLSAAELSRMSPEAPSRIALISSGVDEEVFPTSLTDQIITSAQSEEDSLGYGTYAASVLLQLHEGATITSFPVYAGVSDTFSAEGFNLTLAHIINNSSSFDAVLIAIPPSDYLDPITAAMAADAWDDVLEAATLAPLNGQSGQLFSVAMDNDVFSNQRPLSQYHSIYLSEFRKLLSAWDTTIRYLEMIEERGISVVAPAGDLGPGPQTIFGVANLAQLITLGAFNATGTVSLSSGGGPTIDHRVKPDLLAPTGIMGLLPTSSVLADHLRDQGALDPSLSPAWSASDPSLVTPAKALLDTTLTSASIAAAAAGSLAALGIRDPARHRGALYRRAIQIDDVEVWRQGQGVLGGEDLTLAVPTATFASEEPMVTGHLDLGLEPTDDSWDATATVVQGSPSTATVGYRDFIGVDIFANVTTTATTSDLAPEVSIATHTAVITVTATAGADEESGFYCGYVEAGLMKGTQTVYEDIPFCATKGFRPVARSFEIHDLSAVTQTFELAAALPPGASVLEHPLHFLPINPVGATLFTKITGSLSCIRYSSASSITESVSDTCDGLARFNVIPPGYFQVRAWADYGNPIISTTTATASNTPVTHNQDIGATASYSNFKTLLLPRPKECIETYGPHDDWSDVTQTANWPKSWKECTKEVIDQKIRIEGVTAVTATSEDRATASWLIAKEVVKRPDPLRVNLGFLRKSIDASVSSRYIDIIRPCKELRYSTLRTPPVMNLGAVLEAATGTADWQQSCDNLESLIAGLDGSDYSTGEIGMGIASYPFKLTTPNYLGHMSLNFSYELQNAYILVMVVVGWEINEAIVTPSQTVVLPPASTSTLFDLSDVTATGYGNGTAHIDWKFLPRGISEGMLIFNFIPAEPKNPLTQEGLSWAKIKDNELTGDTLSFELDTFATAAWPPMNYLHRLDDPTAACSNYAQSEGLAPDDCGHTFRIQSHFNPWTSNTAGEYSGGQIKEGECRTLTGETEAARVCEEWVILAHLPKVIQNQATETMASLMDVVGTSTSTYVSLMDDLEDHGGAIYSPTLPRFHTATVMLGFGEGIDAAETLAIERGGLLRTNGAYFDQIYFPYKFLRKHPGEFEVCINDRAARDTSICGGTKVSETAWSPVTVTVTATLPRYTDSVPSVCGYVNYRNYSLYLP